jgi:aspartate aminotransferase
MDILSNRINNLSESATLEMARKSRELKSLGKNIINLSIGEPDFDTPECIKQAGIDAINDNHTHYTPVAGMLELREAIAKKLKAENGLEYEASQIVVSNGAKQSISNAIMCLVNPGDEVIIPSPYWVSYPEMVKLAMGIMVDVPSTIDKDFKVTAEQIEAAITDKTKVLLINSPSNPTGTIYTYDELKAIAEVIARHKHVHVISDEIYEYINYNGKHESIAQFEEIKERVIVVNGMSKGYAMTGWRIGYLAASPLIAKACDKLQGQVTSGACTISQMASLKAAQDVSCVSKDVQFMINKFQQRRDLVLSKLQKMEGVITNIPSAAFYVFPNISYYFGKSNGETTIQTGKDLCLYLLDKANIAIVPGAAFGNPNCVRISYATSSENLKEALSRMKDCLQELK